MILLPARIAISYYFETKRALATGIAECGAGIGIVVFPQMVEGILKAFESNEMCQNESNEGCTLVQGYDRMQSG